MTKVTHDFETQSECNLKKAGAYEYSMHPTTRVLCFAFKPRTEKTVWLFNFHQMQKPWSTLPAAFRAAWVKWINDDEFIFSAHNAYFEQCIYRNVLVARLGWPEIPIEKYRCDAAKCAYAALPRNLQDAGAVARTMIQKDPEGHRVMMKLCKPTSAWTQWKKAHDEINSGVRVGPKKRKIAEKPEPMKFWTPETAPEEFEILYRYCKVDVLAEEQIDMKLPDLPAFEQRLWFIDQKINLRGVQVDRPLVTRIAGIMADEAKVMNKELDILTMGLVSSGNQRDAIMDFLSIEGIEMPDLRAKTVDDFLANGKVTGDNAKVLEIRRALSKSSTAKYQTFATRSMSDGRVRDILLFLGAQRTGRWAGKGVQPQNFPRGVIKNIYEAIDRIKTCSVEELKMLYGENLMPLFSSVLRGMFIATPGYEMYVEDYNAIECRVLWWLAGHEKGLDKFRKGLDPYRIRAADIFQKHILEVTDDERQVGKAAELGCGYQMGDKKFVTSAWDVYRAKVTADLAKVAVASFRKDNWPVVEMWEHYQEAAISAVENPGSVYKVGHVQFGKFGRTLYIQLPSGRRLSYVDPEIAQEPVQTFELNGERLYASNAETMKKHLEAGAVHTGEFYAKKLKYWEVNQMARKEDCIIPKWARESTYGGKLVENVTQAVSRDILAEAVVRAEDAGFDVLMHSHDENVSEAPIGKFKTKRDEKGVLYCPDYRAVMEELPKWAVGLPLKASGWAGDRYRKG